jgi:uncharacterized membrane protein
MAVGQGDNVAAEGVAMKEQVTFALTVIHVLAVIGWVGGGIFLAAVVVPVSRGMQPPGVGVRFLRLAATRFRGLAWGLLLTAVISGLVLLQYSGIGFTVVLEEPGEGDLVRTFRIKYALVAVLLALSFFHDFVLGPRVAAAMDALQPGEERPPALVAARRRLIMLARVNLVLALAVVVVGLMIVRGIPG